MKHKAEHGQAMAETALFALLAVLMAYGLLSWIPVHRARTAATAAAYACSQFLSQSPDPARARQNALHAAWQTLDADWSGTFGVQYRVQVSPSAGPGQAGGCQVSYQVPALFASFLQGRAEGWGREWFISRSETWKARWQ